MDLLRQLREKEQISYTISDDSDPPETPSAADSSFSSPEQVSKVRKFVDLVDEETDEEDELARMEVPKTPPPRVSSAGHSLRQHKDLHQSLRAQENGDKPARKKIRISYKGQRRSYPQAASDDPANHSVRSARNTVRDIIASETAVKRSRFFIAKKDYFLPLLPESNHIARLVEQARSSSKDAGDLVIPYEELTKQPIGVTAVMKPYQLSGLSFLVYLQRNGLSGILGDEMGLGKTLQTLSLIQYLKESNSTARSRSQTRPCLVICPLSVLSSWMAETRRWVPTLKVLRFHGPAKERDRLKKIALGEIDMYGNDIRGAQKKRSAGRTGGQKGIVDLTSEADEDIEEGAGVDLVVTTYETFTAEQSWFKRAFVWRYAILDEGHKIKNDLSLVATALQGLGAEYRLILTGTPLQNNLVELWSLLHWLYPEIFTERTSELFKSSFDLSRGKVSTTVMDDARRLLELIMLRRMKDSPEVDLNLPLKTEVLLFVPLTPMQRFWYQRLLTKADQGLLEQLFAGAKDKEAKSLLEEARMKEEEKSVGKVKFGDADSAENGNWEESKEILQQAIEQEQQDSTKATAWRKLMNLLMQLRKCCNHPYLLPNAAPEPYFLGEHVIRSSGKFIVLDKLISQLVVKEKKKVLIFSGFTRMLDCCEDFLQLRGGSGEKFKYLRLDGGTGRARRNLGIRMFNDKSSEYRVMLISTRAGGLGINLATASDVVFIDQDWNPQIMLQAEARAHRIGQTNPVTIYKLCTQGTVEEQMMGRIQKKLYLSTKVTESMRNVNSISESAANKRGRVKTSTAEEDVPQLDTSQLMTLVRRGAQALSHPDIDVNEMLEWDWATTLQKCKDQPADILVKEQTSGTITKEEDERKWLSQMEQVETRVFLGKKYSKQQQADTSFGVIDATRQDRRMGKNTTVMVNGFAISKESMLCGEWEAVPTLAGKDPRLAEPKREKRPKIINQEHCQVCWDGGDLTLCSTCPRSYHYKCLDRDFKAQARSKMQFHCPQHQCVDCSQKTADAGGMIYRCRWCERGYCEDCLDWSKTVLLDESLKEFEILGFGAITQAFYIQCHTCTDHHAEDPEAKVFCNERALEYDGLHKTLMEDVELQRAEHDEAPDSSPPSRAESLTDATTLDCSGVSTPQAEVSPQSLGTGRSKRKAAPIAFTSKPSKRSARITI